MTTGVPILRSIPSVALLLTAACASAPASSAATTPAPAEPPPAAAATTGATLPPGAHHTLADARFMEHMIHHHAQALEMVQLIPARTSRSDLRLMGERIEVSQRDEIAQMQRWLRKRGHSAPEVTEHAHHSGGTAAGNAAMHAGMPGMATPTELARLAAARGPDFERLFLELMIRHHEGALVMVQQLFSSPGAAQETETWSIASEVESDQRMEITRMQGLLAAMR